MKSQSLFISSGVVVVIVIITIITTTIVITKNNTESTEAAEHEGKTASPLYLPFSPSTFHSYSPLFFYSFFSSPSEKLKKIQRPQYLLGTPTSVQKDTKRKRESVKEHLSSRGEDESELTGDRPERMKEVEECFPSSSSLIFYHEYRLEQNRTLQLCLSATELIVVFPPCSPNACCLYVFPLFR